MFAVNSAASREPPLRTQSDLLKTAYETNWERVSRDAATEWTIRLKNKCTPEGYDQLCKELQETADTHSLLWEREYHLRLVSHLSYLLEQCRRLDQAATYTAG